MNQANSRPIRRQLAKAFVGHRERLAEALFYAAKDPKCSAGILPDTWPEMESWGHAHYRTAVDLAMQWLRSAGEHEQDLLVGWLSQLTRAAIRMPDTEPFSPGHAVRFVLPRWRGVLQGIVSPAALDLMDSELLRIAEIVSRPVHKRLRVLFIGDCLVAQILACIAGPCAEAGIAVESVYMHNNVPALLRNEIRALEPAGFDLVFYSPFSYTFSPEYGWLVSYLAALCSSRKCLGILDKLLHDASQTTRLLFDRFACPIYVHNASAVSQEFGLLSGIVKYVLSLRNRLKARRVISRTIKQLVSEPAFAGRVRLLDETELLHRFSDFALGRVVYSGLFHHPSVLSIELARGPYMDALGCASLLATKKVVVCDLDNTLWDGVIGEGSVEHFTERQTTLKRLRNRGILLSINSKNDPQKVHFSGSVLSMDDFVAPRINWRSKVFNLAEIIESLNIKEKDFIFIDDRPDELERIRNAFPLVAALDAKSPSVWRWLAHWGENLSSELQEDRTQLYRERAAREEFLAEQTQTLNIVEDEAAVLADLNLAVKIEHASGADLKRAVELINRTNQFNLTGARVTLAELEMGLLDSQFVLTAAARDKFGSMGIVGVMVTRRNGDGVEIPIFVLSCRVFGFGIEYALLNTLREITPAHTRIVGNYRETQHNAPCREFYSRAGLVWESGNWLGTISSLSEDPSWLSIQRPALVSKT